MSDSAVAAADSGAADAAPAVADAEAAPALAEAAAPAVDGSSEAAVDAGGDVAGESDAPAAAGDGDGGAEGEEASEAKTEGGEATTAGGAAAPADGKEGEAAEAPAAAAVADSAAKDAPAPAAAEGKDDDSIDKAAVEAVLGVGDSAEVKAEAASADAAAAAEAAAKADAEAEAEADAEVEAGAAGEAAAEGEEDSGGAPVAPAAGSAPPPPRAAEEAVKKRRLPEDFYYDAASMKPRRKRAKGQVAGAGKLWALHHSFGWDSPRRNNLYYLDEETLMYAAGNTVQLLHLPTGKLEYIFGRDGCGIGALAVHPSRRWFAVAEKGDSPNIYIYEYPTCRLYRVLRKGTERAYTDINFSHNGEKLASVGSYPDFMLTVWDWADERIILRSKAFSQEVHNVSFSPDDDGRLTTSGMGHIRFWEMATTFTGLKLQGAIGMFGRVELSDIYGYAELPDGKVLSGTETGQLLLWDGHFIKCEVFMLGGSLPHEGNVNVVFLDRDRNEFVTAGEDGAIRWWDFGEVDAADVTDDKPVVELEPLHELQLPDGAKVFGMLRGADHWVVQDGTGCLWRMDLEGGNVERLLTFHAGAVSALDASPVDHFAASTGSDGTVRCWDYVDRSMLFTRAFNAAGTALRWMPTTVDMYARVIAVGFADGVVRMLLRARGEWKRLHVFKPHNAPITAIEVAPSGRHMATAGEDGTIFLFHIKPDDGQPDGKDYTPLGFVSTLSPVTSLSWRADSNAVLATCVDTTIVEFRMPRGPLDTAESFELALAQRNYVYQRRPKLRAVEVDDESKADGSGGGDGSGSGDKSKGKGKRKADGGDDDGSAPGGGSGSGSGGGAADGSGDGSGDDGADGDGEEGEEEEEEEEAPIGEALSALYIAGDSQPFFLSMGGADAGKLYACDWDMEYPQRELHSHAAPVRTLRYSSSGRFLLSGADDGTVRVYPATQLRHFLQAGLHDGNRGSVQAVATSFDDRFLLSAGADGQFFVYRLAPTRVLEACEAAAQQEDKAMLIGSVLDEGDDEDDFMVTLEAVSAGDHSAPPVAAGAAAAAAAAAGGAGASGAGESELLEKVTSSTRGDFHEPGTETLHEAMDIDDAEAYSIQDAKLKTEEDNRRRAAEVKKDKVREQIRFLRADFQDVLRKNAEDSADRRLARDDFNIDADLVASLHAKGRELCAEAEKVLAWESERKRLRLHKLKAAFLDPLSVERMRLTAFQSGYAVESFRTPFLSAELQAALREVHELLEAEEASKRAEEEAKAAAAARAGAGSSSGLAGGMDGSGLAGGGAGGAGGSAGGVGGGAAGGGVGGAAGGGGGSGVGGSALPGRGSRGHRDSRSGADGRKAPRQTQQEIRKAMRAERKAKLAALESEKPAADAEDPRDVSAIRWAERHMGDYKLKTAADYVVPESQRVNAEKKRRQMVLLEESIDSIKTSFNSRFLELRELKQAIIATVKADNQRLRAINESLGLPDEPLLQVREDDDEWPELRERVTDDDLAEYEKRLAREASERADAARGGLGFRAKPSGGGGGAAAGGDGGDGAGAGDGSDDEGAAAAAAAAASSLASMGIGGEESKRAGDSLPAAGGGEGGIAGAAGSGMDGGAGSGGGGGGGGEELHLPEDEAELLLMLPVIRAAAATTIGDRSELERMEEQARRQRLLHEKSELQEKQATTVRAFDEAIYELKREKFKLDADLKTADLRMLVLYHELNQLKDFEKRDVALASKLDKCRSEKAQVVSEITECQEKLTTKQAEMEVWQEKDKLILSEFSSLVGDNNPFQAALLKLFKKKVKRAKKSGGDGDEDSDSDYDDFDDYDDEDDFDEEEEEDACPPGCDQALYDKVLELREKRLDQEEIMNEFQKAIDELRKTNERLQNRERQIDKELTHTEREIESFQTEKQHRLNELDIVITLRFNQLMCLDIPASAVADSDAGDGPASSALGGGGGGGGGGGDEEGLLPGGDGGEGSGGDGSDGGDAVSRGDGSGADGVDGRPLPAGADVASMPSTVADCIVFSKSGLKSLRGRIRELETENRKLRQQFKDLHKEQRRLTREKRQKVAEIDAARARCDDVQLLKFGQTIDLDKLERSGTSRAVLDVRDKLALKEREFDRELAKLRGRINASAERLLQFTQENTARLERIGELTELQQKLEKELNAGSSGVHVTDQSPAVRRDIEERNRLVQLVKLQARQVDALKAEINMLRRKGGHVFTPAAPAGP